MEHHKISNLLNNSTVTKFVTKKWIELNYLSGAQYFFNENIRFKTSKLCSDLCDRNDVYFVEKRRTIIEDTIRKFLELLKR